MQFQGVPLPREETQNFQSDAWTTCWHTLTADVYAQVMVLEPQGRIVCANRAACDMLNASPDKDITGAALRDFKPAAWCASRLRLLDRVASNRHALAAIGAMGGCWRRTVYRPFPLRDAPGGVLCVSVPLREQVTAAEFEDGGRVLWDDAQDYGDLAKLTERELHVLRHIGAGLTTADIAHKMHRSKKTVEWHRVSLGSKLAATNRVELARVANQAGLVWFDDACFDRIAAEVGRADGEPDNL